jgi:hypothetical protein
LNSQINDPISQSFRNTSDRAGFLAIYGAFAVVCAFFLIVAATHNQMQTGGFVAFWCLLWWFLTMEVIFAIDTSELLVSENGMARKILGLICQRVKWTEVTCIRQSFVETRRGTVVVVRVISASYPRWQFRLRGQIMVSHKFERFDELIDFLNQKIFTHQILVEINKGGSRERQPRLLPPPRDTT